MASRRRIGIVGAFAAGCLAACSPADAHPAATPTRSPTTTTECMAGDFKVGNGGGGAYQGDAVYSMVLLNISGAACVVNAAPSMTVTLQSGAAEQVMLGNPAPYHGVTVGPGQILHVMIGTSAFCSNPSTPQAASSLTVDLPGGSLVDNGAMLNLECGAPNVLIFTPVDTPASTPVSTPNGVSLK